MSEGQTTIDVPAEIVEYIGEHQTVTLATASPGGVPRASTFLYVSEGATLYFWTRASTLTARHIQQNPVVSFAIDDYTEDLNNTRGLQGTGECSVLLSGEQIARVADLFGQKFPSLSPGSTMSISFFRVTPTEIQLIDNSALGRHAARDGQAFGAEFHRDRSFSVISDIADLEAEPARSIVASLPSLEAAAGETIVRQGGPADKFFILLDGEAEVIREESAGLRVVETLRSGSLVGEMAIMRDLPRWASIIARTDVRLLVLDRDTFRDLIAKSMGINADFDQVIRTRLDGMGRG